MTRPGSSTSRETHGGSSTSPEQLEREQELRHPAVPRRSQLFTAPYVAAVRVGECARRFLAEAAGLGLAVRRPSPRDPDRGHPRARRTHRRYAATRGLQLTHSAELLAAMMVAVSIDRAHQSVLITRTDPIAAGELATTFIESALRDLDPDRLHRIDSGTAATP
jgi:hypothetical protein